MNRKLSVIVPAYKEGNSIIGNLGNLEAELIAVGRPYEIVLICDGCLDTYTVAKTISSDTIKVFYYEKNIGKGHAPWKNWDDSID